MHTQRHAPHMYIQVCTHVPPHRDVHTQGPAHTGRTTGRFPGESDHSDACARRQNPISCSSWTHQSPGVYRAYQVHPPSANSPLSTLTAPSWPGASHRDSYPHCSPGPLVESNESCTSPWGVPAQFSLQHWTQQFPLCHPHIQTPSVLSIRITCSHTCGRLCGQVGTQPSSAALEPRRCPV